MANLNDVITLKVLNLTVNQICKNVRLDFRSESPNKRKTSILAAPRFEKPFDRDVFRFNQFSKGAFL